MMVFSYCQIGVPFYSTTETNDHRNKTPITQAASSHHHHRNALLHRAVATVVLCHCNGIEHRSRTVFRWFTLGDLRELG